MFASHGSGAERATKLLETVGLGKRLHHKPRALSVGEQQRVAIARALVNEPSLVLADEPTGSLDAKNGGVVLQLLRRICAENKHTLLVVTHDLDFAREVADRILFMEQGVITAQGTPRQTVTNWTCWRDRDGKCQSQVNESATDEHG